MSALPVLRAGLLEVRLLPQAGGSIARFDRIAGDTRQPLLRGTDDDNAGPLDSGCFPLVPYCNRIRGGTFQCDGQTISLAPNAPPDPSPLHGQGWLAPWELVEIAGDTATLGFAHQAGEWPWSYQAHQYFALDPAGLSVTLACRNLSDRPMPCGLGLHPYYPCDAKTRLDARVNCAWTVDENVLPVSQVPATDRFDMADRAICGQDLDNGFGGWNGRADFVWPGQPAGLRLTSPDAPFFQVYSPASGGLFVAEPVQHANTALNAPQAEWERLGIAMLAPGEERRLHARFVVITDGG